MASATEPPLRQRPIKRVEYERLTEQGFFDSDERLELLDGLLVVREPQHAPHASAVRRAVRVLRAAFGPGWLVDSQLPIALDDVSEPEPDVAVVPTDPADYREGHPARPVLIVEIADSSLAKDRGVKLALYARAGITDYWIVNLIDRVVEAYREPVWSPSSPHGWRYASLVVARPGERVTPLAAPHSSVAAADLLP
jgi:Uma2 family endonuclease